MTGKLKILIIGNYRPDNQVSMDRFADLLVTVYANVAEVRKLRPFCLLASANLLPNVVNKYLAYVDKLIIFPVYLFFLGRHYDIVHIADHSNSFYSFFCPSPRTIITCHDLLAVRAGFGDSSAYCSTSFFGVWLQHLIMAGLKGTNAIIFDSQSTYNDFVGLTSGRYTNKHRVISLPLNAPFTSDYTTLKLSDSELSLLPQNPFILMVGSSLERKNRLLAFRLLELIGSKTPYHIVFAGSPLTTEEQLFQQSSTFKSRIYAIHTPSHTLLNALYCNAHALLFPSFSEGFGWPPIEAQACKCPVVASNTTSIPEVAGDGALYADPTDVAMFANHIISLEDFVQRDKLVRLGLENVKRYDISSFSRSYLSFALDK